MVWFVWAEGHVAQTKHSRNSSLIQAWLSKCLKLVRLWAKPNLLRSLRFFGWTFLICVPVLFPGTSRRKAWKECALTGGTASPLSTTTSYSWPVSSLCCCLLCCTCCDSAASIGAQLSAAPPPLYRGWKRALAHPRSLSTSKFCRA